MIRVRVLGVDAVLRRMTVGHLAAEPAAALVREVVRETGDVAERGAPSEVARSMHSEASSFHGAVVSMHPASAAIEGGRRPGAPMPPPSVIARWAAARGLSGVPPFVIARAIGRRGLRGRFFMRAAVEHARRRMGFHAERAAARIVERWRS